MGTGTAGTRTFVAGASGVIGVRLVPLLVEAGHVVAGMTRTPAKTGMLTALGARPVVCDVYDREALVAAVADFAPDILIHQLTDLPDDPALVAEHAEANIRIRDEGTRNLLAAAREAGVGRFLAQSLAWAPSPRSAAGSARLEELVIAAGGVVLRYGQFYGPGTFGSHDPELPHVEVSEAARQTVAALDADAGSVVTVVDP